MGQPVWAGIAVYAIGLAGMLLVLLVTRAPVPSASGVSWWAWTGGLISIVATMAGLMLTQKLGSGAFTGLSITAAMVTSVLLDHFGVVGLARHPASPLRIAGCALMIAGAWLIARF